MNNLQLFFQEVESRFSRLRDCENRIERNLDAQYIDGMIYGAMLAGLISADQRKSLSNQVVVCQLAPLGADT